MIPTIITGGLMAYLNFLSVRVKDTEPNSVWEWAVSTALPVGALLWVYFVTGWFKAQIDRTRKRLNYLNAIPYPEILTATGFLVAGSLTLLAWDNTDVLAIAYLVAGAAIVGISSYLYMGLYTRFNPGPGADSIAIQALTQELEIYRSLLQFASRVITVGVAGSILGGAFLSDLLRSPEEESFTSEELTLFTVAIGSLLTGLYIGVFAPILTWMLEVLADLRAASRSESVEKAMRRQP